MRALLPQALWEECRIGQLSGAMLYMSADDYSKLPAWRESDKGYVGNESLFVAGLVTQAVPLIFNP